jgi:hypothetical protein
MRLPTALASSRVAEEQGEQEQAAEQAHADQGSGQRHREQVEGHQVVHCTAPGANTESGTGALPGGVAHSLGNRGIRPMSLRRGFVSMLSGLAAGARPPLSDGPIPGGYAVAAA